MSLLSRIKQVGPVRKLRRERYRRLFESAKGHALHNGVFRTFDEATAAVPKSAGFSQTALAEGWYDDRLARVFPYDYPLLFWLQPIFAGATSLNVVDIGGHVGVHYYAYEKFLRYPPQLRWRVIEVDVVARAGRARAAREGAKGLEFATSFDVLGENPTDIVFSAGALHYVERPLLWDAIERAKTKPRHIFLNKLPLYDGEDFVSLQNIGAGFSPLYVWNRQKFIRRFERIGYQLVDDWSVLERHFELFDDPTRSFGAYSGLYLRRS